MGPSPISQSRLIGVVPTEKERGTQKFFHVKRPVAVIPTLEEKTFRLQGVVPLVTRKIRKGDLG
jgi:hypothetical protein